MNLQTTKTWAGRVAALAVTGAIATVPFLDAQPAEAQTYYRERVVRRTIYTMTGRVVRDFGGSNVMVRSSNGRDIRVHLMGQAPRALSRRDRIQVTGYFRNNIFHATNWRILRDR